VKHKMAEKFNGGKSFDFEKYDDKVKLGQSIIDIVYEKKQ